MERLCHGVGEGRPREDVSGATYCSEGEKGDEQKMNDKELASKEFLMFREDKMWDGPNKHWKKLILEFGKRVAVKARKDEREKILDQLFRLDWIKILQNAIQSRPEAWIPRGRNTYKPAEWRNASDTLMSAVVEEMSKK